MVVDLRAEERIPGSPMSLGKSHILALAIENDNTKREGMLEQLETLLVEGVTVKTGEKARVPRLNPLGRSSLRGGLAQAPQSPRFSTTGGAEETTPPLGEAVYKGEGGRQIEDT